jgi:hypothetical protein
MIRHAPHFLLLMLLLPDAGLRAELAGAPIRIEEAVIAAEIDNLTPAKTGTQFDAEIGRIYCFTRVTGNQGSLIRHLWFQGDTIVMEVELPVRSSNWRTYSMKTIGDLSVGKWRVDVTSEDGTVLATIPFTIE